MKWWDIKTIRLMHNRSIVNRFFNNLETRGGIVNGRAYLLVYNEQSPELSYILSELI